MPQAINLIEMVQYQPSAVVSRARVKKETGTVTLFAFDSNESLSEHSAPFEALVLMLEGEMQITIAGEPHRVLGGQTITLPANLPHALKATIPSKMVLIMIRE